MQQPTFLSIIIPASNEENRLPSTLEKVFSFLAEQPYTTEVIIVENGSTDRTAEIAQSFVERYPSKSVRGRPQMRLLQKTEQGKGLAVRSGMLAAKGEYRFMCDVDLSMPITEVNRFLPPALLPGFDIAIGSREAPGAIRYNEPYYRHLGGRAINAAIRLLALPGLHDTQCGFKCFRAPVAKDLFRQQTLTGWSFDIELLYIARMRGYHIIEIPIPWYFNPESKLNVVQDAIYMTLDILKIRRNAHQGKYRQRKA
ncbi:MAG: dolichyl-phosphate beta-glucosyltransferase [Anaerolineales bacterium]